MLNKLFNNCAKIIVLDVVRGIVVDSDSSMIDVQVLKLC